MRIIKLGIISFVLLFAIVTLMSLFIPSRIRISRAVNLSPSATHILSRIKDTNQWKTWHPAFMKTEGSQKMVPLWRIPVSSGPEEFICKVQYMDRKPVTNGWRLYTNTPGDSLTIQWYMDFQLSWYPWQKFGSLFYESSYGRLMETGMTNLKATAQ
jgi:hypothetical protein